LVPQSIDGGAIVDAPPSQQRGQTAQLPQGGGCAFSTTRRSKMLIVAPGAFRQSTALERNVIA
jgi:hypothetical protein